MTLKVGTRVVLPMRRGEVTSVFGNGFMFKGDGGHVEAVPFASTWLEESLLSPEPETLLDRIRQAINATGSEKGSDTPDFILAAYLTDCLAAFDKATRARQEWESE